MKTLLPSIVTWNGFIKIKSKNCHTNVQQQNESIFLGNLEKFLLVVYVSMEYQQKILEQFSGFWPLRGKGYREIG